MLTCPYQKAHRWALSLRTTLPDTLGKAGPREACLSFPVSRASRGQNIPKPLRPDPLPRCKSNTATRCCSSPKRPHAGVCTRMVALSGLGSGSEAGAGRSELAAPVFGWGSQGPSWVCKRMEVAEQTQGPGAPIPSCPLKGIAGLGVFPGAGPGQGSGFCRTKHAPHSALTAGIDS